MAKLAPISAGLLVFRRAAVGTEFLLVHPGGPFWKTRDEGAWSIPKGLIDASEAGLAAAIREFNEEVGLAIDGDFVELDPVTQKAGKTVLCWLVEADLDLSGFASNLFDLEWPRGSGRWLKVPECDRAAYFDPGTARRKILAAQAGFIDQAMARLGR
jgi:predicted NUDIX family NTP pyrophosphohydrolase